MSLLPSPPECQSAGESGRNRRGGAVNGSGIDGGSGIYCANAGEDVHAVGSLAPIIDGYIGCTLIRLDGSRILTRAVPDPLAQQKPPR